MEPENPGKTQMLLSHISDVLQNVYVQNWFHHLLALG